MDNLKTMNVVRVASSHITSLEPNEIFVFGSNLQGYHGGVLPE